MHRICLVCKFNDLLSVFCFRLWLCVICIFVRCLSGHKIYVLALGLGCNKISTYDKSAALLSKRNLDSLKVKTDTCKFNQIQLSYNSISNNWYGTAFIIQLCICIHMHMYIWMCSYVSMHMRMCIHLCVYVNVIMLIYMYIY